MASSATGVTATANSSVTGSSDHDHRPVVGTESLSLPIASSWLAVDPAVAVRNHRNVQPIRTQTTLAVMEGNTRTGVAVPDRDGFSAFTDIIIEKCEAIPDDVKQVVNSATMKIFDQIGAQATELVAKELSNIPIEKLMALGVQHRSIEGRMSVKNPRQKLSLTPFKPRILFGDSKCSSPLGPLPSSETMALGEFGEKGTELIGNLGSAHWTEAVGLAALVNSLIQAVTRITQFIVGEDKMDGDSSAESHITFEGNRESFVVESADQHGCDGSKPSTKPKQKDGKFKKRVTYLSVFCFTAYICCSVVMDRIQNSGGESGGAFSEAFQDGVKNYVDSFV